MIKTFNKLKRDVLIWIMVVSMGSIFSIIFSRDIFREFTPRNLIFNDSTLTLLQAATCSILFITLSIIGVINILIYLKNRHKGVQFNEIRWFSGIASLSIASIFFIEVINISNPLYWIDTIIRIIACLFMIIFAIVYIITYKSQTNIPSRDDIEKLREEIEAYRQAQKDVDNV
jgi:hypothetical protein